MITDNKHELKTYSDTYLYQSYPKYQKILLDAIMKDPIIDKSTKEFEDVVYEVKRTKLMSESLVRILNSTNTILLDPVNSLPRSFKVFCSKDPKDRKNLNSIKVFIDCSGVISKKKDSREYSINDIVLVSYLMQAGINMVYFKSFSKHILTKASLIESCAKCFTKLFTHIIDYLAKVSIQESSKIKTMYLASKYFYKGILNLDNENYNKSCLKIAGISEREATMLDILIERAAKEKGMTAAEANPYMDIKTFIRAMAETLKLNDKVITTDIVVEKWMTQYGPGTVMGIEYFPALSAMLTDAYNGGYVNSQKTIEKVCGADMVDYTKQVINLINSIA